MTPIGVILGGAALVGVGVGVGHWWNRRERDRLAAQVRWLRGQVTEAVRIIEDLTDQRLADAAGVDPFPTRVPVPPQVWRALQEAREKPEVN